MLRGCRKSERERMLENIGMVDFVVVEMTEYLDTHPDDRNALEYFNHYNRLNNKMKAEYAAKFGPLTLADSEPYQKEWRWGMEELPWEVRD